MTEEKIEVSKTDWHYVNKAADDMTRLLEIVHRLPAPVHGAIMHEFCVVPRAKREGREVPLHYQYEPGGIIWCPSCGRMESAYKLETYPDGKCPDCGTVPRVLDQVNYADERIEVKEVHQKHSCGPVYADTAFTISLERMRMTWQEAYDLGWQLLQTAQKVEPGRDKDDT